ncbi:hypothetical protein ACHAXT_003406 [Thalassiosira profunda]
MAAKKPPLLLLLVAARAAALVVADKNGAGSCADGGGDGTCPPLTETSDAAHQRSRRQSRPGGLDDLPPIYRSQLKHLDERLRGESEDEDPVVTCDAYLKMGEGHGSFVDPVAITESMYQEISWAESTDKPDKCLTLDDTLQICNSYRPHYHEYFVHFPAAYLPQMKRAIFIGGGDSMLLHELLKYPDMELIVGLELDQAVVRDSLKHFFTQPHFDLYPKVQWWFGDAAKSLRLLPREWYGTFDLVMVDLSETVMSVTVSEELDILRALALLLNPQHGILVKNEKYLDELSGIFDFVIQIYLPDTPLLCDQDWVLGSFGVDFLHPDFERLLGKYEVPTYHHYQPRENAFQHNALIKDYAKNDIDLRSHCTDEEEGGSTHHDVKEDAGSNLGIFMVVEAENATLVTQIRPFEEVLSDALTSVGLHLLTSQSFREGGQQRVMLILQEGYIIARVWPTLRYCAFDLHFWSGYHLLDKTRELMLHAVGAENSVSSYNIVVGGIHGTDKWRDDVARIGPAKTNIAECKESVEETKESLGAREKDTLSITQIALQESLALIYSSSDEETVTVVFCGLPHRECESLAVLTERKIKAAAIWQCPEDSSDEATTGEATTSDTYVLDGELSLCRKQIDIVLREIASQGLRLIVIDEDAPSTTVIDLANALLLVIFPSLSQIGAYFLELLRMDLLDDLLRVAVVSIEDAKGSASHYLGYLSIGNPIFLPRLVGVMDNISRRTQSNTYLAKMKSNPARIQAHYSPHHYTMFDYNEAPGMDQYSTQMPLGKQTLLQMNFPNTTMTEELLALRTTDFLQSINVTDPTQKLQSVGDGVVIYSLFSGGHVIVVWDGRHSLDLNVYLRDEATSYKTLFREHFMKRINLTATLTLWEEQPRGVGRVVNVAKDIIAIPGCVDRYLVCDKLEEYGECDAEEKEWMHKNCPLACDVCPTEKYRNTRTHS